MAVATYEVIGDLPIVDCETNKSMPKGSLVRLDDTITNIDALFAGGLIGPAPTSKKKQAD